MVSEICYTMTSLKLYNKCYETKLKQPSTGSPIAPGDAIGPLTAGDQNSKKRVQNYFKLENSCKFPVSNIMIEHFGPKRKANMYHRRHRTHPYYQNYRNYQN